MSNNSNYIQETENVQQEIKKYWSYLYELRHIPTGLLYVGSRSRKSVLKKFEDCYTDDYLGSSCREEGPFSKKDTETNPQDYAKTVLKVFYDKDAKKANKYEHGSNGLIMTYWNLYGKDKVLNEHCILNDGSEVFSTAGLNVFANKTEEEMRVISQKMSDSTKKTWEDKTEEEKAEISQKMSGENNPMYGKNAFANKTEEEMRTITQKRLNTLNNRSEEEKEKTKQKKSENSSGEKNGSCTQYQHPYNHNFIGNGVKISKDIKNNYPNEKQWSDFTKKEKNLFKI